MSAGAAVSAASFDHAAIPQVLRFTFDRDIGANATPDDFPVRNLATGATVAPNGFAYDPTTRTATLTFPGGIPNGDWRVTIPAAGTGQPAGDVGALPQDFVLTFFSLAGDLNRDRTVNGSDFAILAANFGKTGLSFPQVDLNGDGMVNGTDFAMLAGNFGRSLPPPPAALVAETMTAVARPRAVTAPASAKRTTPPPRRSLPARPAPTASPVRRSINRR